MFSNDIQLIVGDDAGDFQYPILKHIESAHFHVNPHDLGHFASLALKLYQYVTHKIRKIYCIYPNVSSMLSIKQIQGYAFKTIVFSFITSKLLTPKWMLQQSVLTHQTRWATVRTLLARVRRTAVNPARMLLTVLLAMSVLHSSNTREAESKDCTWPLVCDAQHTFECGAQCN